jgi:hypothetical protein
MLEPGKTVVCINDDFGKVLNSLMKAAMGLTLEFPSKGKKYTIRNIFDNEGIVVSVTLEEIWNPTFNIPLLNKRRELAFKADRFAPLEENEMEEGQEEVNELLQEISEDVLQIY